MIPRSISLPAASFLLFSLLGLSPSALAVVPSTFTYQGSLKQSGTPVNGNYSMEFRITNSTGALYWTSGARTVAIVDGLYKVDLSPTGVDWRSADSYMEIKLGGTTLLPRERLTSSVYALVAKELELGTPILTGEIRLWPTNTAPSGWHICDGSPLSRSTFSDLFAVIGTTFGSGDGTTTFNLPDFRRRVPVGAGGTGSGVLANTIGATGGEESHTLTTTEMPNHSHSYTITNIAGGSQGAGPNPSRPEITTANTGSTGGGAAHNNIQPSLVINFIIKD